MMMLGGLPIDLHLHPEVVALCVGLLAGYAGLIARYGRLMHPRPGERSVTPRQVVAFVSGVAALWVASGSVLHDLAEHYLYSAHMVQHVIQGFIVPPLLLLGLPEWMAEYLLRNRLLRSAARGLSRPLVAALGFNVVMALIHWPAVVDAMLTSEAFHAFGHAVLIVTGLGMWANVVSPAPRIVPRLTPLAQMAFLFVMTLLPTVPASFLTFGDTPLYGAYEAFPRLWGISALEDMRIAGLIMKIGAGFLLWGIIAVMFFRWAAAEERNDRPGGRGTTPTVPTADLPSR